MNRDWYNAPLQGGSRSAHDYGNSGPIEPMRRERAWSLDYVLTAATIFLGTLALVAYWPS